MASKLLLALFPPNQSFSRFELEPEVEQELAGAEGSTSDVQANLAAMERLITREATRGR